MRAVRLISFFALLALALNFASAKIEVVEVASPSMKKSIKNVVVTPTYYEQDSDRRYPVVYLLHGYGGNHMSWVHIRQDIEKLASDLGMIIVCPDGANSWYYDSPVNKSIRYETYVTKELIPFVDSKYRTDSRKSMRAVAGLSMGGHGAMWLGVNHQDLFCASGILSGGVDIRPFPKNWNLKDDLGEYEKNPDIWDSHTCVNLVPKIGKDYNIYIDCGTEDFFYKVNLDLHNRLLDKKIPHVYIARPGKHDGAYWNNAIDYQLLYFSKIFSKNSKGE